EHRNAFRARPSRGPSSGPNVRRARQAGSRAPIGSGELVPEQEELAVVKAVVGVMRLVVRGEVRPARGEEQRRLVNEEGPEGDHYQGCRVDANVDRKEEGEQMGGQSLKEGVHRMKGKAGPGCGRREVVMVAVDQFVQAAGVKGAVNPVDEGFRKDDQGNDAEEQVAPAVVTDVEIDPTRAAK